MSGMQPLQRHVCGVAFCYLATYQPPMLAQTCVEGQYLERDGPIMLLLQVACAGV